MDQQEGMATNIPPLFTGEDYAYWSVRMRCLLMCHGWKVWAATKKVWMKELEALEETQLSVINEVSIVDVENNEVIDKNDTHHEGNLLSDVKEYPNADKDGRDDEGDSDCGIYF